MKVTTIEEAQDICNMKVEDIIGPLQTFKLAINDRFEKKNKSITFISNTENKEDQCDLETDEGISNAIVLLGRQFNKVLKIMDRMSRPNVKNMSFDISKNNDSHRKARREENPNQGKGETDDETAKHVTSFTSRYEYDEDSCAEDVSYEEFSASYKELCVKSKEVCKTGEEQKRILAQLQAEKEKFLSTVTDLENKVTLLSSKLEKMTKSIRMLNNGSGMLYEIIQVGKGDGNLKGICFNYQYQNKQGKTPVTKFIPLERKYEPMMSDQMLQHPARHQETQTKVKFLPWKCDYYGKYGHIKPFCYRLYGYPKYPKYPTTNHVMIKTRKEWKPKIVVYSLIAHTSLRAPSREDWYFDSGCSRHMTGVNKYLVEIKSYSYSFVTFGDGAKGEIKGIRKIGCTGPPRLDDVLLMKGLTANLISIS
ncbi:uncharacterized protein LOC127082468 [Lathyrus oleraceus]|uniref:uncharacterized protein LOC127082468 n=1 Tax=Pisum sativum TaxID=3888 RepID=UPI0021D32382|nr:uncharacterized protein LOC127082468 [Pisum sativum]